MVDSRDVADKCQIDSCVSPAKGLRHRRSVYSKRYLDLVIEGLTWLTRSRIRVAKNHYLKPQVSPGKRCRTTKRRHQNVKTAKPNFYCSTSQPNSATPLVSRPVTTSTPVKTANDVISPRGISVTEKNSEHKCEFCNQRISYKYTSKKCHRHASYFRNKSKRQSICKRLTSRDKQSTKNIISLKKTLQCITRVNDTANEGRVNDYVDEVITNNYIKVTSVPLNVNVKKDQSNMFNCLDDENHTDSDVNLYHSMDNEQDYVTPAIISDNNHSKVHAETALDNRIIDPQHSNKNDEVCTPKKSVVVVVGSMEHETLQRLASDYF